MTRCRCSLYATTTCFLLENHNTAHAAHAAQWNLYSFCFLSVLSDVYNDDNTINSLYARFILFTQCTHGEACGPGKQLMFIWQLLAAITLQFVLYVLVTYSTSVWPQSASICVHIQYIYIYTQCMQVRGGASISNQRIHIKRMIQCVFLLCTCCAQLTYVRVANIHMYNIYLYHQFSFCSFFFCFFKQVPRSL